MWGSILTITLLIGVISFNIAPIQNYNQCNSIWRQDQMGTSQYNICQKGDLLTCLANAELYLGKQQYNPGTLNKWLKNNHGYINGYEIVLQSLKPIGLQYKGKISNKEISSNIDAKNIVIISVHNGTHRVYATKCSGNNVYVIDPGYQTTYYTFDQIKDNQTIVFKPI